jgi:hypothetical protein
MLNKPRMADRYGWDEFAEYAKNKIGFAELEDDEMLEWEDRIVADWWPIWKEGYIAGRSDNQMLMKYKQYACSYGSIIVYENDEVEFIPNNSDNTDLDFDNSEACELVDEDVEEFEEGSEINEFLDNLGKGK